MARLLKGMVSIRASALNVKVDCRLLIEEDKATKEVAQARIARNADYD